MWLNQHLFHQLCVWAFISPQPCQHLVLWSKIFPVWYMWNVISSLFHFVSHWFLVRLRCFTIPIWSSTFSFLGLTDFLISFSLEPSEGFYQELWTQVEEYSQPTINLWAHSPHASHFPASISLDQTQLETRGCPLTWSIEVRGQGCPLAQPIEVVGLSRHTG